MITVRQLERLWTAKAYNKLIEHLMLMRPEDSPRLRALLAHPLPVAAMAVIRLDELNQAHTDLARQFLRFILTRQHPDGSFGDPMVSALCLRALMCGNGAGLAIESGLRHLASLQRDDGLWPAIPLRRLPGDCFVSAFVLFHLAASPRFNQLANLDQTMTWFDLHRPTLDPDTARLSRAASLRSLLINRIAV